MGDILTAFIEFTSGFGRGVFGFGDYILILFVLLCLINATVMFLFQIRHKSGCVLVNTEVIDLSEHTDSDGDLSYTPTFRISDGTHEGVEWASRSSSNPAVHKIGEQVPATYNPDSGVINSAKTSQGNWIIAAGNLLFAGLCIWILVRP